MNPSIRHVLYCQRFKRTGQTLLGIEKNSRNMVILLLVIVGVGPKRARYKGQAFPYRKDKISMGMKTLEAALLQLMKNRRSIRKYGKDPVPLEKIYAVLEAGRYAPSGANLQPWIYIVVTDKNLKEGIRREAEKTERSFHENAPIKLQRWFKEQMITPEKSFLTEAPVLVVVAGYTKAPYWLESTWVSIAYILLSIESRNLGTLTYTPPDTFFLNKLLSIPEDYQTVAILPIGHPAERPSDKTRARRILEQTVHLNRYDSREEQLERSRSDSSASDEK